VRAGWLLDSSCIIAAERGKLDLAAKLEEVGDLDIAISTVTASEILHAQYRAPTEALRMKHSVFAERILAEFVALPFDLQAARVHAQLAAALAKKGQPVGTADLLIAATALACGYGVATRDLRSFPKVPGLEVAQW
jgi:tRNA(fMet)-specific endonuclease VapC